MSHVVYTSFYSIHATFHIKLPVQFVLLLVIQKFIVMYLFLFSMIWSVVNIKKQKNDLNI